jgi:hypothetical protein
LAWALAASFLCEKFGRRLLFLTSALGMLVFWTCQTVTFAVYSEKGIEAAAHSMIAFIFLFYAAYDIAFTPLIVLYTVEILPYPLRAKGFTVFNFTISLALIFNQYVNPIAIKNITWRYWIVYIAWIAFEAVFLYRYVIETKNLTLEETAAIFDGEEAEQNVVAAAAAAHGAHDEKGSDSSMHEKA